MRKHIFASVAVIAAATLALASCSSSPDDQDTDDRARVVTSTGVWGDIAATVGGDAVTVSTIIGEPGLDPHEYQTTPADALAVSKAELVVHNGGGYDQFMESILQSTAGDIPAVDAYTLPVTDSGLDGTREQDDENEHVWFDLSTVDAVAAAIADELSAIDPDNADMFADNAQDLQDQLRELADEAAAIKDDNPSPVITTEPVTYYLLAQAGIEDLTPSEFGEAIEQGTDPAPAVIADIRSRLDSGDASALVYNIQTESPTTESLRTAAERAGLPVVLVSESLPEGEHYTEWVRQILDELRAATVK